MKKSLVKALPWIIFAAIGISIVYFISRLINLTIIPIFTDEAIYLRWAQIGLTDPRWRFISLIDGKQPLLIWLFFPALKLISDPLVAGRLVSVISGFFGMFGLALFAWVVTKSLRGALFGAFLYLLMPFNLMYDRLAIYDGLLSTISIWTLFLTYLLGKTLRFDVALLLGTVIGAGLLTKSSANYFLILLPVSALLVHWAKKTWIKQLTLWISLQLIVIIQSQIYNNILRLSEFRHIIGQKNLSFIYSFSEIIKNPFQSFWGNLNGLWTWLLAYMTLPIILLLLFSAGWFIFQKKLKLLVFFSSFFLVPFLSLAMFGKVIYPRFLLFMLPGIYMIIIMFIAQFSYLKNKLLGNTIIFFIFIPVLIFDWYILTDPVHAPLPLADRQQLLNDWPAGYGISEVVNYLQKSSEAEPIIVGTEGTFGLFPMALELYLGKNPNVTFKAYWPLNEIPQELVISSKTRPTYVLFKERQMIPNEWPLELIAQYQRGDGPTYLKFYRVVPKS